MILRYPPFLWSIFGDFEWLFLSKHTFLWNLCGNFDSPFLAENSIQNDLQYLKKSCLPHFECQQKSSHLFYFQTHYVAASRCPSAIDLSLIHLGHFFSKKQFYFLMLFTINVILLYKAGPIQWMCHQHCGCWWPGALAPGISSHSAESDLIPLQPFMS